MSEDVKDEIKKLKEELADLKEHLKNVTEERPRRRGIYIDVGDRMHDYVEDVMEGVAEGIHGELDKSVFIGPRGIKVFRERENVENEERIEPNFSKVAEVMSALGQEHRLKVLNELMYGGKYINELEEKLPEIAASTLSSHLNILEEAGLVVQEKVRGRYLITLPGRTAYKMAQRVTRFIERRGRE